MIRSTPSSFPMLATALVAIAGTVSWSTAASAQSTSTPPISQAAPSATGDIIRLTDEQRMSILDGNTAESAAAARGELPDSGDARRGIHGEVGVMIGSHGTRGAYGTAEIPLGDHAAATVSIESSRFGYRR
jgi:hypothetical protein